jgi:hypothetical protein
VKIAYVNYIAGHTARHSGSHWCLVYLHLRMWTPEVCTERHSSCRHAVMRSFVLLNVCMSAAAVAGGDNLSVCCRGDAELVGKVVHEAERGRVLLSSEEEAVMQLPIPGERAVGYILCLGGEAGHEGSLC